MHWDDWKAAIDAVQELEELFSLLGIISDWCLDEGLKEASDCLRWCVTNRKYPFSSHGKSIWLNSNWREYSRIELYKKNYQIPKEFFEDSNGRKTDSFDQISTAYYFLIKNWHKNKNILD